MEQAAGNLTLDLQNQTQRPVCCLMIRQSTNLYNSDLLNKKNLLDE
jgi:hypothetical protein